MSMTLRTRAAQTFTAVSAVLVLALAGCGGDDAQDSGPTPAETLASAKETLDQTPGVRVALSTEDLPRGVDGVVAAEGIGTHAPAFDGSITVAFGGAVFDVPVISVDDTVWAKVPLTIGWSDIDPGDYGAPDPATLMSTESGFSSLLTATDDLAEGESVRGGEDNDEVLTEYTGTVSGEVMANIIPSATGLFDVTYTVTDTDELREMTMTGVFYPDSTAMTYAVGFSDYGIDQVILAP